VKQSVIHMIMLRVYLRCFTERFYLVFMASFSGWSPHNVSRILKTSVTYIIYILVLSTSVTSLWNEELHILEEFSLISQTKVTICIYTI